MLQINQSTVRYGWVPLIFLPALLSLSHFHSSSLSLIAADAPAAFLFGHLITGPDFTSLIPPASPQPPSTSSLGLPFVSSHLLLFLPLVPILSHQPYLPPHPVCGARRYPYRWVQSSMAEGNEAGSSLHARFAPFQPHSGAAVCREAGTKWRIYWLNEKISFFDC